MNIKTLDLISSLNTKELKGVKFVIKNRGNNALIKLIKVLETRIEDTDKYNSKEEIVKSVYKRKLDKKVDDLFRNDLRIINEVIEDVLIETSIESKRDGLYISELHKRGLSNLAEKETRKRIKTDVKSNWETENLIAANRQRYNLVHLKQPIELSELNALHKNCVKLVNTTTLEFLHKKYFLEYHLAFIDRQIESLEPDHRRQKAEHNSFTEIQEAGLQYAKERISLHAKERDERIATIETLLQKAREREGFAQDIPTYLTQLGLEYLIQGNWVKATENIKEFINDENNKNHPNYIQIYFNYLSALAKSEKYSEVLAEIGRSRGSWKASKIENQFNSLQIICALLENDVALAEKVFPQKVNHGSDALNFYLRLLQAIIFYSKGAYELCENEILNTKKRYSQTKLIEEDISKLFQVIKMLNEFKQHELRLSRDKRKTRLDKISAHLHQIAVDTQTKSLPFIWFEQHIEQLM